MNIHTPIPTTNPILRLAIYEAHRGQCFYTGRKVEFSDMVIDHILPKAKGGQDCIANYVLTYQELNNRKTDRFDVLLVERMLYINQLVFAPDALQIFLANLKETQLVKSDESALKPYLKKFYPSLMPQFSLINAKAKANLNYRLIDLRGNGRNTLIFKIADIENLLDFKPLDRL